MTPERAERSVEGRPLEDGELVRQARDGDVRAYERLVERYRDIAFRTAYLITRSSADAEDAAANEARNRSRSTRRREHLALRLEASGQDRLSGGAARSPEEAAVRREQRQMLLAALEGMKEQDRLVIACRYLLDLSEAETASMLGLRPGTVRSRLSRALERLRSRLPEGLRLSGEVTADG